MAEHSEDYEQARERVAEALYRLACPSSTPDGWELYKGMRGRAERFYAQADAAIAALSGSSEVPDGD